jgi:hypothetical protein
VTAADRAGEPTLTEAEQEALLLLGEPSLIPGSTARWVNTRDLIPAVEAILRDRLPEATTVTEWGVREPSGSVYGYPTGGEKRARYIASLVRGRTVVQRSIHYGPWEEVPE